MIYNTQSTPSDTEIKEIQRKKDQWYSLYNSKKGRCDYCNFQGMISAERNGQGYLFRCQNCDAEKLQNLSQSIPYWSNQEGFTRK